MAVAAPQFQGQGKAPAHVRQPVGEAFGNLAIEEVDFREVGRGARAAPSQEKSVEEGFRPIHDA
jgi:hypothetical protein